MSRQKQELHVRHILADGREVDNIEGYVVRLDQVPQFKQLLIKILKEGKI